MGSDFSRPPIGGFGRVFERSALLFGSSASRRFATAAAMSRWCASDLVAASIARTCAPACGCVLELLETVEVQKSQIHVNEDADCFTLRASIHDPGRDLVKHMLGQTGDIVKKLFQTSMGKHENPHLGLSRDRGIARVTRKDSQFPNDVTSGDSRHRLSIPRHCCGPIDENEHFKADLTLGSEYLPNGKDQLVSNLTDLLQLFLAAVREDRN